MYTGFLKGFGGEGGQQHQFPPNMNWPSAFAVAGFSGRGLPDTELYDVPMELHHVPGLLSNADTPLTRENTPMHPSPSWLMPPNMNSSSSSLYNPQHAMHNPMMGYNLAGVDFTRMAPMGYQSHPGGCGGFGSSLDRGGGGGYVPSMADPPLSPAPPAPPAPAQERKPKASISAGSVGHPETCSFPCKYAFRRGCKDDMDCNRCHLCPWTRETERRARQKVASMEDTCVVHQ